MPQSDSWQILLLLFLTSLVGCGDSKIPVSGRVTLDGQSFRPVAGQVMKVVLLPMDSATANELSPLQKAELIASVTGAGEFNFTALPSGKYIVTASDFDRLPSSDRLADHFRQAPTDIVWEISGDTPPLTLALEKAWFQKSR